VGLVTKASLLKKLVGWETGTVGYHGDDGCLYTGSGKGHAFGPTYSEEDVIGCGVNFVRKKVFFTKNGNYLGDTAYPLSTSGDQLYAAFGMKSPGESAQANYGLAPFSFDIEGYIQKQQRGYSQEKSSMITDDRLGPNLLPLLILGHLIHSGCEKTALSFFKKTFTGLGASPFSEAELIKALEKSRLRKRISDLILTGEVQQCLDCLQAEYPNVLANNPDLDFLLHCRLFVEGIAALGGQSIPDLSLIFPLGQALETKAALVTNKEYYNLARDALALIAYKNIGESPSAYLLGPDHKQMVASLLDEALLREDKMAPFSSLELLIRAYQASIDVLKELEPRKVVLLEPTDSFLRAQSQKPD